MSSFQKNKFRIFIASIRIEDVYSEEDLELIRESNKTLDSETEILQCCIGSLSQNIKSIRARYNHSADPYHIKLYQNVDSEKQNFKKAQIQRKDQILKMLSTKSENRISLPFEREEDSIFANQIPLEWDKIDQNPIVSDLKSLQKVYKFTFPNFATVNLAISEINGKKIPIARMLPIKRDESENPIYTTYHRVSKNRNPDERPIARQREINKSQDLDKSDKSEPEDEKPKPEEDFSGPMPSPESIRQEDDRIAKDRQDKEIEKDKKDEELEKITPEYLKTLTEIKFNGLERQLYNTDKLIKEAEELSYIFVLRKNGTLEISPPIGKQYRSKREISQSLNDLLDPETIKTGKKYRYLLEYIETERIQGRSLPNIAKQSSSYSITFSKIPEAAKTILKKQEMLRNQQDANPPLKTPKGTGIGD